jgi:hypothetical protein
MLVSYCKSNNIKLLYSTWIYDDNINLSHLKYIGQYFIEMNGKDLFEFIANLYPKMSVPDSVLKKRDGHSGSAIHQYWTSCFMKEIEKRGLFND